MIPKTGGMRVPGVIYTSEALLREMGEDESPQQVMNVAHLPGIVKYSLAMPDMHWGYGFPIGGVAAFDVKSGVISPGGVGYDINCGCRMMTTRLKFEDIRDRIKDLVIALFQNIPSGVGSTGVLKLSQKEERQVLTQGTRWAVSQGYGTEEDIETTEDYGSMAGADPDKLSPRAMERGKDQLGTLGSGNHFLEIEVVEEVFDSEVARVFDLSVGQVVVLIHSGSRGLGYQVCDDYLARMVKKINELGIVLPDRQLACSWLDSTAGKDYLAAMACAANYAWANRQMLMHWTRETFEKTLRKSPRELGMKLLYDVCHNIAKLETFPVDGEMMSLCVHRKGATRSFPPGHPALPERYRKVGQPVLIPGDMGTESYLCIGTDKAMLETFGSSCHGAGRVLSRTQSKKKSQGRNLYAEMANAGIFVMAEGKSTMAEEMPDAYKNVTEVVNTMHNAGITRKVALFTPIGVIKG